MAISFSYCCFFLLLLSFSVIQAATCSFPAKNATSYNATSSVLFCCYLKGPTQVFASTFASVDPIVWYYTQVHTNSICSTNGASMYYNNWYQDNLNHSFDAKIYAGSSKYYTIVAFLCNNAATSAVCQWNIGQIEIREL